MSVLPEPLASQLRDRLGFFSSIAQPSTQGLVWRITTESGERFVAKATNRAALERERLALTSLADHGLGIPVLLHVLPGPPSALLLSWLPGTTGQLESGTLHKSGAWLRRLHTLSAPPDTLTPAAAVRRRADAWQQRAAPWLPAAHLAEFAKRIDPSLFRDAARVWCHRDFTPSNWRVGGEDDSFSVLDFGQARPDIALWDLCKLWALTENTPRERAALLDGYGRLGSGDLARLEQLVLLHGLQTFVWGAEHEQKGLREEGLEILRQRGLLGS